MKYIRTKNDKIYEIIDETENSFELCGPFEKKMGCSCTMIKRLLGSNEKPTYRLADTIEELCDELVFDNVYHSRMTPSAMHTKENQEVIKSYLKQNIVCYGAIWTDKGLIYVAKMNEKGELELL